MKKIQLISLSLVVVFVVIFQISIFIAYDHLMLLLDAGASTTAINSEAASKLDLWDRFKTMSIVADGRKINTELAYLDYI